MAGKIPILVAGVLVLAGGGFVAFRKLSKEPGPAIEEKKPVVLDPGVLELDPFILNLADPAGDRYFRLNLSLVLDQMPIAQRAGEGRAVVKLRDRVLTVLAKKRASQLTSVAGKEQLRAELQAMSESLMTEEPFYLPEIDPAPAHVLDVLFVEFLVQ